MRPVPEDRFTTTPEGAAAYERWRSRQSGEDWPDEDYSIADCGDEHEDHEEDERRRSMETETKDTRGPTRRALEDSPTYPRYVDGKGMEWEREMASYKAAEKRREELQDEVAAARVAARRLLPPDETWLREVDDPRFEAWLAIVKGSAQDAVREANDLLADDDASSNAVVAALRRALSVLSVLAAYEPTGAKAVSLMPGYGEALTAPPKGPGATTNDDTDKPF